MGQRLELQDLLEMILGSRYVYFQPPASVQMEYPAIVYARDDLATNFANNHPYRFTQRYTVTIIDRNPDSEIPLKIANLPMSVFNRYFAADNLNHDVYTLYF